MKIKLRPAIAGKVAIITGASSGIGEVTALEFASAGAKVVLAARRIERLQKLAETIRLLKSRGYTILMVEQNFRFAAPLADRFYVIEHGRVAMQLDHPKFCNLIVDALQRLTSRMV